MKDLEEVYIIIRWHIIRNHIAGTLKIDQTSFIQNFIESKNETNYNSVNIPIKPGCFIEISKLHNYKKVDIKLYQYLIGKLMYLSYGTKPNIVFAIGELSKHNSDPRVGYMKVAKKVVRYLKRTIHIRLVYRSPS